MVKTNDDVSGLALDDANVYWSSPSFGVWSLPKLWCQRPGLPDLPRGISRRRRCDARLHGLARRVQAPEGRRSDHRPRESRRSRHRARRRLGLLHDLEREGAFRVNKNGGPSQAVGESDYASYCAVHGNRVYWISQGSPGAVYSAPKNGGAQETPVSGAATPYGIAADDRGVYFAELDAGKIWMLPADGSSAIELASGRFSPCDEAIDELAVYWTNDASQERRLESSEALEPAPCLQRRAPLERAWPCSEGCARCGRRRSRAWRPGPRKSSRFR